MNEHSSPTPTTSTTIDVLVVGGGAAGLATALVLARSRRDVVLVDAGEQRNAPAARMHNYLGRESAPPLELVADGRREVEQYGAQVVKGRVTSVEPVEGESPLFSVRITGGGAGPRAAEDTGGGAGPRAAEGTGTPLLARRIVLATGVVDELPDIPGLAERWGRDVLHCPYCHGWEVRDQRIGVLQTSPGAMHQVGLFRQLSEDVVLLANGRDVFDHGHREQLDARGVRVVEDEVAEVLVEADALVGVRTSSGEVVDLDALVVASVPRADGSLATSLGVAMKDLEMGGAVIATALEADPMTGATSVDGVHAVGNAAAPMATVIASASSGTQVGAFINAVLVEEDTAAAVQARREAMREPDAWDERYSPGHESVWSGNVNPQLPAHTMDLPRGTAGVPGRGRPRGTALDVGCGEGGDAIWLAGQGWRTTGMDFSPVGLRRAEEHAVQAGVEVDWRVGDARTWVPSDEQWDLVTMHYLHLPIEQMRDIVRRLAGAVAPGGTMLVVGHHPDDVAASGARPRDDMFFAEDLVPALDDSWDVQTEEADRTGTGSGAHVHVRDTVLLATRAR